MAATDEMAILSQHLLLSVAEELIRRTASKVGADGRESARHPAEAAS